MRVVTSPVFIGIVAVAVIGFAVWAFFIKDDFKTYTTPSEAMAPTYKAGDRIKVNLDAYSDSSPEVGDVVVFHPPKGADSGVQCGRPHSPRQSCPLPTPGESAQTFLKRIAAGPGVALSIQDGHPVIDGVAQTDESFITPCGNGGACNLPKPITIPPGHYFMLGDNRGASDDSRFWGPVPEDWIIGRVE